MNSVDTTNSHLGERKEGTRRAVLRAVVSAGLLGFSLAHSARAGGRAPTVRASSLPAHDVTDAQGASGGWVQEARLVADDTAAGDWFGRAVSLDGTRALVGANQNDAGGPDAGAAYVFGFDGSDWRQTQRLVAGDAAEGAGFGADVSLDGARALVGAPRADASGRDSGAAYVFEFDGSDWRQTQRLVAGDAATGSQFGAELSLDGTRALVGATESNRTARDAGLVYVFEFDGSDWRQTRRLTPTDTAAGDRFGEGLSLDGTRALVGASRNDVTAQESGAAYVFEFDGSDWRQTRRLTPEDATSEARFGGEVSLDGTRALVGAAQSDGATENAGAAYVFEFDGSDWRQAQRLAPEDAAEGDRFGGLVSLDGSRALVGAPRSDASGQDSGAAYVFGIESQPTPTRTTASTDPGLTTPPTEPPTSSGGGSTPTEVPNESPTEPTLSLPAGFPGWPTVAGVGLVGIVVGFLTSNAKDDEARKTGLGLLAAIFGGGVLITLLQTESGGWLVAGIAAGVIVGIFVGIVLRRLGFTFAS
jgi:hypothetical protein